MEAISECVVTRIDCHAHIQVPLHLHVVHLLLSCLVAEEVIASCRRLIIDARIALKVQLLLSK